MISPISYGKRSVRRLKHLNLTSKAAMTFDPVAMTVPYASIADNIRNNRGFVDSRVRPDKANENAEGNASPAVRRLLVPAANVRSTIFTLGCELGSHKILPSGFFLSAALF